MDAVEAIFVPVLGDGDVVKYRLDPDVEETFHQERVVEFNEEIMSLSVKNENGRLTLSGNDSR